MDKKWFNIDYVEYSINQGAYNILIQIKMIVVIFYDYKRSSIKPVMGKSY